ncbi:MAG: hypothetical protein ACREF7_01945 [Candidatus Saccharimonadales bacterium]
MYQIAISGAARGESVEAGKLLAQAMGQAIARSGHALMSGATVGLPNYTAEAYKAAGGKMSVGMSPASSKVEHVLKYHLPIKAYDTIIYSGLHYIGRDSLLITSSDAVVSIGGRMGTLHEFTIAVESNTPIGFLQGAGGISEEVQTLISLAHPLRDGMNILFNEDPDELVKELVDLLDKEHGKYKQLYY